MELKDLKEVKREYNKQYYQNHKNERKELKICEVCKGTYNRNNKYYHFKSKKHLIAIQLTKKDHQIKNLENKLKVIKENLN